MKIFALAIILIFAAEIGARKNHAPQIEPFESSWMHVPLKEAIQESKLYKTLFGEVEPENERRNLRRGGSSSSSRSSSRSGRSSYSYGSYGSGSYAGYYSSSSTNTYVSTYYSPPTYRTVYVPSTRYSGSSGYYSSYGYYGGGYYGYYDYYYGYGYGYYSTSIIVISRYGYYTPTYGSYLGDGSFCYENAHCASGCCAVTAGDNSTVVYEEDLEDVEEDLADFNATIGNCTEEYGGATVAEEGEDAVLPEECQELLNETEDPYESLTYVNLTVCQEWGVVATGCEGAAASAAGAVIIVVLVIVCVCCCVAVAIYQKAKEA